MSHTSVKLDTHKHRPRSMDKSKQNRHHRFDFDTVKTGMTDEVAPIIIDSDSESEQESEDNKKDNEDDLAEDGFSISQTQLAINLSLELNNQLPDLIHDDDVEFLPTSSKLPDLIDDDVMEFTPTSSKLPDLIDDDDVEFLPSPKSDSIDGREDNLVSDASDIESVSSESDKMSDRASHSVDKMSDRASHSVDKISDRVSLWDRFSDRISDTSESLEDCVIEDATEDVTSDQRATCQVESPPAKKPRLLRLIPPKPLIEDISEVIDLTGEFELPDLDDDTEPVVDLTNTYIKIEPSWSDSESEVPDVFMVDECSSTASDRQSKHSKSHSSLPVTSKKRTISNICPNRKRCRSVLSREKFLIDPKIKERVKGSFAQIKKLTVTLEPLSESCLSSYSRSQSPSSGLDRHFTDALCFGDASSKEEENDVLPSLTDSDDQLLRDESTTACYSREGDVSPDMSDSFVSCETPCQPSYGGRKRDRSLSTGSDSSSTGPFLYKGALRRTRCRTKNCPSSTGNPINNRCSLEIASRQNCLPRKEGCRQPCLWSCPFHIGVKQISNGQVSEEWLNADLHEFSPNQVSVIQACSEEGNGVFIKHAICVTKDFANSRHYPTPEIIQYLLNVLLEDNEIENKYMAYWTLKRTRNLHPPHGALPFSWEDLENVAQSLHLRGGTDSSALAGRLLALEYMVDILEAELLHRSTASQRQIVRSMAAKWLSADTQLSHIKNVVRWISSATLCQEYNLEQLVPPRRTDLQSDQYSYLDGLPKLLPTLQRLLELTVAVSTHPEECAKKVACELSKEYSHLPTLPHKRLLVKSITSPLIRFKLVQRVLEDHCDIDANYIASSSRVQLCDIINCYFCLQPLTSCFTPPLSPRHTDDDDFAASVSQNRHSPESCEELAMLLFIVAESYMAVNKGFLILPTGQRTLEDLRISDDSLSAADKATLQELPRHVEALHIRLLTMGQELTARTHMYLSMLQCMALKTDSAALGHRSLPRRSCQST